MKTDRPGVMGVRGLLTLTVLVFAMAGWIAVRRWSAKSETGDAAPSVPRRDPIAALPAGAILAGEIDLDALRQHPATRDWLREPRTIEGLGAVRSLCGVDPLEQVDRVAFAVPELATSGFGIVASGGTESGAAACAERMVAGRGGEPTREVVDGVTLVRDRRSSGAAVLAVDAQGRIVLAEEPYLRQILKVISQGRGSVLDEELHGSMRKSVGPGALVVSAVLTDALRKTLLDELDKLGKAASPLSTVRGGAIALALGERLRVRGVLVMTGEAAATLARDALATELESQAATPLAGLVGYAPLLERIEVAATGAEVTLNGELAVAELVSVLRRVVTLGRLADSLPNQGRPASSSAEGAVGVSTPAPSASPN